MLRLNKKAQSTLEYAVLIFIVVAALIAMQVYVKRGIQGRIRASSDDIGEQYSPGATRTAYSTVRDTKTHDTFGLEGEGVTHREFEIDKTVRTGEEEVGALFEDWDPYATP